MIDVTITNFQEEVIAASMTTPVLVDFWAPGGDPGELLGPLLEQLEAGDSAAAQETMQRHIDNIRSMAVEALMANPALRNVQLQPARPSRIRSTTG